MDFRLSEESERFRAEVRAFLDAHLTHEVREHEERTGDGHHWGVHRELARRGWVAAPWPKAYGGQERNPYEMQALHEELRRSGYPIQALITTAIVGDTLCVVGTEAQKREVLPRVIAGDAIISLGYTEPECGSDVFAVRTRAVRDGDGWVIDGQKMFTTFAHIAQYVFLLTRTDPDAPKLRGLTLFLVPLDTPGIEFQPVRTLGGERTNLVYYSGVRVPDSCRVGEVNGGTAVMSVALRFEQGSGFHDYTQRLHDDVLDWLRRTGKLDEPHARERLARTALRIEVGRLLGRRLMWMQATGQPTRAEGPMSKLFSSEGLLAAASDLLDLGGPRGLLERGAEDAAGEGALAFFHRFAQGTTIYAGTSEVMRSLIAEKHLGLPRSRS